MGRRKVEDLKKKEHCGFSIPRYVKIAFKHVCKSLNLDYNEQATSIIAGFCIQHFSTLKEQDGCIFLANGRCEVGRNPQSLSYPEILICFTLYKFCNKYLKAKEELTGICREG